MIIAPTARELAEQEVALCRREAGRPRGREAEADHKLGEHIGLPKDVDCASCSAGRDPLTIGIYDAVAVEVEVERERLTHMNRERVAWALALYADLEAVESLDVD